MGVGGHHSGEFHNANEAPLNDRYFPFGRLDRLVLLFVPTLHKILTGAQILTDSHSLSLIHI